MLWHSILYYLLPLFFFLFFLLKRIYVFPTNKNHPPSPPKLPIIGNLHQIGLFPHRSLHLLAQTYGPLMLLRLGRKPTLVVSSSEAAREIMKTHDLIFSNRPKSTIASKLLYNGSDVAFTPYGEYWRQIKSICVHQLLSNKMVQSFRDIREEETGLVIEKIKKLCFDPLSVINLSDMFALLTNNIVCKVALGRKYSSEEEEDRNFKELLGEFEELLGIFDVGDYIPWFRWVNKIRGLYGRADNVAKEFDEFLESVLEEHEGREKSGDQKEGTLDFVDVLLEMQKKTTPGFSIQRENIKAIILDMFVGGTDTTYAVLEWTMTELLRHPDTLKELQKEVRGIGKGKQAITEVDLEEMHYLKAVIKESMRLHPPSPLLIPRESTRDVKLMGYDIAAGTQVFTNAWSIGRDPSMWDEAEEFRPERFLNNSVDFRGHDYQLIPFGAGRRGCPGLQFAVSVDELALANLVNNFDFALADGARGEDLDMSEISGLTVHKRVPLLVVASLATPCTLI
uniref:CYP71AU39 n=1 Tax=Maesa lanceolata TaxID=992730 RepID=A0A0B4L054_MAELA|nr:CYP71AU39 [Maesa lanceolata]